MLLFARVKLPISVCNIGSSNFLENFKVLEVLSPKLGEYIRKLPEKEPTLIHVF